MAGALEKAGAGLKGEDPTESHATICVDGAVAGKDKWKVRVELRLQVRDGSQEFQAVKERACPRG